MSTSLSKRYIKIRNRYELKFLRNELIISIVLAIFVVIANTKLNNFITSNLSTYQTNAYPLIAGISGGLLGYIITGFSIIVILPSSPKLEAIKNAGYYDIINRTYISAIFWLSATILFVLLGYVIKDSMSIYIFYIIIFLIIVTIWRIARCVWILYEVAKLFSSDAIKKSSAEQKTGIDQY